MEVDSSNHEQTTLCSSWLMGAIMRGNLATILLYFICILRLFVTVKNIYNQTTNMVRSNIVSILQTM